MNMINKGLFTSASQHWATPKELYDELDKEFNFNDDPCPLNGTGGLDRKWGSRTFMNPPYGKEITKWLARAWQESLEGKTVVCLIPSRTDTRWWHDYVMKAEEIRFLRGRLKFGDSKNSAPFPSAVVIFRLAKHLAVVLLAEWIAIDHNETRLQAHKYYEEGQELADWLFVIGYRLINPTG